MAQTHRLTLLRHTDTSAKESVEPGFAVLQVLFRYGEPFAPRYIVGRGKKNAEQFACDHDHYLRLVERKGRNRSVFRYIEKGEKKTAITEHPEFGSGLWFFTTMDNDTMCGVQLTVGATAHRNSLGINFPIYFWEEGKLDSPRTYDLFRDCVKAFRPYWGAIINKRNDSRFGAWDQDRDLPPTIHWLNFLDHAHVERVGMERIHRAGLYRVETLDEGLLIQATEHPIDNDSDSDLMQQRRINKALDLKATPLPWETPRPPATIRRGT
ncbi:MAG: hypothetical protein M0031_00800 [Thermaerobacter sp.]|jgi:hypothetical protein|nr:hypothetical protein [Thermaerobacter sp.]